MSPEPAAVGASSPIPIDATAPELDNAASLEPAEIASSLTLATPFPSPRASKKGFLSLTLERYLELLDWTGRELLSDKRGLIPADLSPILERLGIKPDRGLDLIGNLRSWIRTAVGRPPSLRAEARRRGRRTLCGLGAAAGAFT